MLLAIDQAIKIYIKTHFYYGEELYVFGLQWFWLHFLENPGMAWAGSWAKAMWQSWPLWLPIWGGNDFEFFAPVFNTAGVWVSTGVLLLLLFQKRFQKEARKQPAPEAVRNENAGVA